MKAGDRFLFDCCNGCFTSYLLCEAAGWWFLIGEEHGNLWCSPHNKTKPIHAFGGEIWYDCFRKLPNLYADTCQHLEDDGWLDVMYLTNEAAEDLLKDLNPTKDSFKKLLIESNSLFKFEDLEKIA